MTYVPPRANAKLALEELYYLISSNMNVNPEAAVIVAGDFGMSDPISVELIPAYRPLICRTKPTTRTIQVWTEEAFSALQDCFEHTDGGVFKEGTYLEEFTSSVLSYISFCTDAVLPRKSIRVFPNQKL